MGIFNFTWEHASQEVYVTGTFDNWSKSVQLEKKGDIFEKTVELPKSDEKILYKFVADGEWKHDHTGKTETDHEGNVNNVLYPEDIQPSPTEHNISSAAPGATTTEMAGAQPIEKARDASKESDGLTGGEKAAMGAAGGAGAAGLFPTMLSSGGGSTTANMAGQQPIEPRQEATVVDDEPKDTGAAAISSVGPNSSTAAMAGATPRQADTATSSTPGAFPETPAAEEEEPQTMSVNPIPMTSGMGNPPESERPMAGDATALNANVHDDPELKAADEAKMKAEGEQTMVVNPLPMTSGTGNPRESERPTAGDATALQSTVHDDPELKAADEAKMANATSESKAPQIPEPEKSEPLTVPDPKDTEAAKSGEAPVEDSKATEERAGRLAAPEQYEEPKSRDISPMSKPPTRTQDQTEPMVTTGTTQTTTPATSKAPETPSKKKDVAPSSASSTPASQMTDGKKEKRRSFFGRIKDKLKS